MKCQRPPEESEETLVLIFFKEKIIFPAVIYDLNNFEMNRVIRLVVSGMFLLPYSASFFFILV